MPVLYDDNFGYWRVDDAEELAFFKYVQSQSVKQKLRTLPRRGPSDAAEAPLRAVRIRARMRRAALDHGLRAVEARKSGFARKAQRGLARADPGGGPEKLVPRPSSSFGPRNRGAPAPRIAHEGECLISPLTRPQDYPSPPENRRSVAASTLSPRLLRGLGSAPVHPGCV